MRLLNKYYNKLSLNEKLKPNKMKRFLLLILTFSYFFTQAQTVLLHQEVDSVYKKTSFGVNSKHYVHTYLSFAFLFDAYGSGESDITKFGGSHSFALGLRYKFRLNNYLATGLELEDRFTTVSYPTSEPVLKEKYYFGDFKYAWYFRFNLGMRGDIMGKFIDMGIWGSSNLYSKHNLTLENNSPYFKILNYTEENLSYIEAFNYGLLLRAGINQFVIFTEYRLSNVLKKDYQDRFKNVPAWTVGLQIGLHR